MCDTIPDFSNYTLATFNQTLLSDLTQCTPCICPIVLDGVILANTSYFPTLAGNALFAGIFGTLLIAQIVIGISHRTWKFLIAIVGGLVLEILGYGARIGMRFNMFTQTFFIMYLVCLTIGPAFLSAAIYLTFSHLIIIYSESNARFKPRTYTYVFISSDVVALLLQAAGGAMASISTPGSSSQHIGINIMVAGVAWQVFSLAIFALLSFDFFLRVRAAKRSLYAVNHSQTSAYLTLAEPSKKPDVVLFNPAFAEIRLRPRFRFFIFAIFAASVFIFVRSVFRCAELSGGFGGPLANEEITFMVLEGCMMILACTLLTVLHPGLVVGGVMWRMASWKSQNPEGGLDLDDYPGNDFGK
ncbi:hypothetical protein K450DRAFT_216180 [Umbelopsis ramanniana AG]|uniref:Sphingoid long-chain base transporter RSB1 n=1 Tax=Umbelopsis ramanniana AG TaxID=1314678 RepID=A0AAD5H9R2_UMBRA|nr:uncharacterized protein K450DRAFT_216180 [Umbelopsis ramanniana AG]KAI8575114.1 hypothetical protein K450DRAFT_216180 [Umbelopsis ramanniana AG]